MGNNPTNAIDPTEMDSIYLQSMYAPNASRLYGAKADTYKKVARISMGKGGRCYKCNFSTCRSYTGRSLYKRGGNLYDYYGNIVGEAPLINEDSRLFDALFLGKGIANSTNQNRALKYANLKMV